MESRSRGVLGPPLEPVIGLAEGETRWRGTTRSDAAPAYFSPTLNGGSLPGGVLSSDIASIMATMT
jgi:hypothetical protein